MWEQIFKEELAGAEEKCLEYWEIHQGPPDSVPPRPPNVLPRAASAMARAAFTA